MCFCQTVTAIKHRKCHQILAVLNHVCKQYFSNNVNLVHFKIIMRPDSLLRFWRYINWYLYSLTYLLTF